MPRKILIAVDGSQHGGAAFDWYVNNMRKADDEVHILHVHTYHDLPAPVRYIADAAYLQAPPGEADSLTGKRELMLSYIDRLKGHAIPCKGHLSKNASHVGYEICRIAEQVQPLCIVMGSRGMNLLRRTFLGSTSDYVLHHSPYTVAIVKHGEFSTQSIGTSTSDEVVAVPADEVAGSVEIL